MSMKVFRSFLNLGLTLFKVPFWPNSFLCFLLRLNFLFNLNLLSWWFRFRTILLRRTRLSLLLAFAFCRVNELYFLLRDRLNLLFLFFDKLRFWLISDTDRLLFLFFYSRFYFLRRLFNNWGRIFRRFYLNWLCFSFLCSLELLFLLLSFCSLFSF